MTREGYGLFYAGPYRRLVWGINHPGKPFDAAVSDRELRVSQRIYAEHLANFMELYPPKLGATVLDAGGSTGVVVMELSKKFGGFGRAVVLDPAFQELPFGKLASVQGYLEDPIPGGPYDLILCCETLDHVTDPAAALRNMRAVLAPGGQLYVDVVDKKTWAMNERRLKIDHPLYWNKRSLIRALEAAGFQIVVMNYLKGTTWKLRAICR